MGNMGCMKKNLYGIKAGAIKKKLVISLVAVSLISAITPIVLAGSHSQTIAVTFTPQADIDLSLDVTAADFGNVDASTYGNEPSQGSTAAYTLTNNGNVTADIYIFTNSSTDNGNFSYQDLATPGEDEFHFNATGNGAQMITSGNTSWSALHGGDLAKDESQTFGLILNLGSVSSTDKLIAQATQINITGIKAP